MPRTLRPVRLVVDLRNNQLAMLPEHAFAGLASLKRLVLDNNQLATLPERVFEGLASLKELCVRARGWCVRRRGSRREARVG